MSDAWDQKRKAEEESYFEKREHEALARVKTHVARKSPVTGEPMTQMTVEGVQVQRCPTSGGVWLEKGELEKILAHATHPDQKAKPNWIADFMTLLLR